MEAEHSTQKNLRQEFERVEALKKYKILDTPPEDAFNFVAQLATKIFGVAVSLVSLVDKDQVFFKANVGLGDAKIAERQSQLCSYVVQSPEVTVFENIAELPHLYANPAFVNEQGFKFYAGAPLTTNDGHRIGTICVIDKEPRKFTAHEQELLAGLAKIVMHDLELRLAALKTKEEFALSQNDLASTNEELKSANEEIAATNEELAASNEELSASLEELQASNEELLKSQEELESVNAELEERINERTIELEIANEEMIAANEGLLDSQEEMVVYNNKLLNTINDLKASERNTKNIVDNAPFPIGVYKGREMRVVMANQSIMDVWGKGNEVVGKLYSEVLPELENQSVYQQLDEVFTTGKSFHARNQRIDLVVEGKLKIHYFNYSFTALRDEEGEVYGVMNTAADVTDIVLSNQMFEEMSQQLAASNEEIQSVNEEMAATNEELQSVNEEMAATNEELQSVNEEVAATNEELRSTNEELSVVSENYIKVNNDLFRSQNDLIFTINAAGLGTFDLDPKTSTFKGNDLLKAWFGLKAEDKIELSKAIEMIATDDRERVVAAIQRSMSYESGGNYDIEYAINNSLNSTPRILKAKGKALFNENKEAIRLSGTLQDITEQKRDDQRKSDFIGMVSHELKTPLTSLTALIQVLNAKLKKSEDAFISGALDKANVQVKKMGAMINGFLNISRLESGKILIEKQQFDLAALLSEIIKETELTVSSHTITFTQKGPFDIYADHDKIGSVITNLISNAVKYSPKDTTIAVNCELNNDNVRVSVKDEGTGIKAEDKDKLFDRYYRVKNANTNLVSGFGIGLYLSAEIIERHNGNIGVESDFGEGSTFYFTLPLN